MTPLVLGVAASAVADAHEPSVAGRGGARPASPATGAAIGGAA